MLWTQLGPYFAGFNTNASGGVATDGEGNAYVAGTLAGCPCPAYVAKYSATGALRWTRELNMTEEDAAQSVATDGDGNVYIAGYTGGPGGHAFVAKYFTRR